MSAVFVLQLGAFFASIVLLTAAVNRRLVARWPWLDPAYLPAVGWGYAVYLAVYVLGRWTVAPVEPVRWLFAALAVGVPLLAAVHALRRRRRPTLPAGLPLDPGTLALVAGLVAGLTWVGPYLEFPTDPVEYLYRIQAWQKVRWMDYEGYSPYSLRFGPFLEHWLLRATGLDRGEREGLGLYAAAMQALLFWQFVRLGTLLGGRAVWGWAAGLLSLGYFGYSAISFSRYVVLSGPLLSYVVYLEGFLLILAAFVKEEWRYLALLPPLLVFCLWTHEQGVLFLAQALGGVALVLLLRRFRTLAPAFRRLLLAGATVAAVGALAVLLRRAPVVPKTGWPPYVAFFGPFPYHGVPMLHEMIGVVGWASVLAAVLALAQRRPERGRDVMAAMAVWPFLVLWNPVGIEVLARVTRPEVFHRLVYGCLYWVLPVPLLRDLAARGGRAGRAAAAGILVGLVGLSWITPSPISGRMRHVWTTIDPRLDGANLRPLIAWLRAHAERDCVDPDPDERYRPIRRYVLSDTYVNTYLLATGYFYAATNRWEANGYESPDTGLSVAPGDAVDYPAFLARVEEWAVCYVVLHLETGRPRSWLAARTRHWAPDHARTARYYSPRFVEWITTHPRDFELVFERGPTRVYRPRIFHHEYP